MKKFNYKFKTVKKIKEILEKQAQKEVALVEAEIINERNKLARLKNEIDAARANKKETRKARASDLQFLENVESELKEKSRETESMIITLEKTKKEKLEKLKKRSMERKTFESLEEKHYESYRYEQNKIEQKDTDEMALNRRRDEN